MDYSPAGTGLGIGGMHGWHYGCTYLQQMMPLQCRMRHPLHCRVLRPRLLRTAHVFTFSPRCTPARYVWASGADGGFSISEDAEGEALGRGTLIRLHLKPEALEYAEVRAHARIGTPCLIHSLTFPREYCGGT